MSKKPKKSRHRVPMLPLRSDPVDEVYQAQVDASVTKLEARYARAAKALERAERKAANAREQRQQLEQRQRAAQIVAERRAAEEARLQERIGQIKAAAQRARVEEARAMWEQRHNEMLAKQAQLAQVRQAEVIASLEREHLIRARRADVELFEKQVTQRRNELHEIELLMMPSDYAGGRHRGTHQPHHTHGGTP